MTRQLSNDDAVSLARHYTMLQNEDGSDEETEPQDVVNLDERPREITGPILGDCPLGRWDALRGQLPADGRTARLFVTASGRRLWFPPDQQPTARVLMRQRVCHVYEIDMGVHLTRVELTLPCAGDECFFQAVVELRWRLTDAVTAVASGLSNVAKALMPEITARLRSVTRKFDIEQVNDAEAAAVQALAVEPLGVEFGLEVRTYISLTMDQPTLAHAALMRKVERLRRVLVEGDYHQFALQLSLDEDSVTEVMQALIDERKTSRQAVLEFLSRMLESDAIERWEVEDDLRVLLQSLREWSNNTLAGVRETPSTSLGTGKRATIPGGEKR
ncbi:hypothetical protein AB0A63_19385 [Lentzea sp. NPDC042327]|uniref:hypothetical protein n=1 Tax=Lentzea sp. NPDC042327 TaxID=3154801 RepID=UPI00340DC2EF